MEGCDVGKESSARVDQTTLPIGTLQAVPLGFDTARSRVHNGIMPYVLKRFYGAFLLSLSLSLSLSHLQGYMRVLNAIHISHTRVPRSVQPSWYVGYARYAGAMFWFWSVRQIRSPFVIRRLVPLGSLPSCLPKSKEEGERISFLA